MAEQQFLDTVRIQSRAAEEDGLLSSREPGRTAILIATAVVVVSTMAFLFAIPFVRTPLPKIHAFIPMYEAALIVTDTITAILLYGQFARMRSLAMLTLASAYAFCAFMTVPHLLTFPGTFSDTGLLGAGNQSTAWLYVFWHGTFPLFVLAYALVRRSGDRKFASPRPGILIAAAVIASGLLAGAFTLLAIPGAGLLPVLVQNGDYSRMVSIGVSPSIWLFSFVALVALWRRQKSTLDLWLIVVMCVWIFDVGLSAVFGSSRYDLGWYAGRSYGLLAASFVLAVLLVETNLIHGRMAETKAMLSGALEKNQERFKEIFDNAPMVVTIKDLSGRYFFVNRGTEQWTEHSKPELIGKTVRDLFGDTDYTRDHEAVDREVIATGKPVQREFVTPHPLGAQISLFAKFPLFDAAGRVEAVGSVALDITEQKKADAALNRFFQTSVDLILVTDRRGKLLRVSPSVKSILGYDVEEMIGHNAIDFINEADLESTRTQMRLARQGQQMRNFETRYNHKDGRVVTLSWTGVWSEDVQQHFFVGRDMTDRHKLEGELRQSQKMEAIGQLTGGLAHDYNNLLTVILGNAELLMESLRNQPDLLPLASATVEAADRSAVLTQRLLAFGRRQALESQPTDLNVLLQGMKDLVRVTVGEQIHVDFLLAAEPWIVKIDRSQLETAVLNLVVNARDAMKGVGTIRIETTRSSFDQEAASISPDIRTGNFMMLAVSDTGSGMTPETLTRVFEPFFTTKEPGKGTGLGLSMVYGFVKQSGGHVSIYSEPGIGTSVKLYFPPINGEATQHFEDQNARDELLTGSESVLLVEDEPLVRANTERQLISLGYDVVSASNGKEAVALFEDGFRPDLLVSDVIMAGGMNGREVAETLRRHNPDLPVLFMSGYTSGVLANGDGGIPEGMNFIGKPFRRSQLAKAVREALDVKAPAAE
ncbi:MAG: MASE4 domain-containing protein [Xanthobacteraceae bacterium]|nr:MASE4 domain-containing protein [Xanthobacteraceae bacterium]